MAVKEGQGGIQERVVSSQAFTGIVYCCLKEAKLSEQLDCTVSTQGLGPEVGHLVGCTTAPMSLSNLGEGGRERCEQEVWILLRGYKQQQDMQD